MVAQFRKGQQPKSLSVDEWINKLWYIHTAEYYAPMKWNEIPKKKGKIRAITGIDFEYTMLCDRSRIPQIQNIY